MITPVEGTGEPGVVIVAEETLTNDGPMSPTTEETVRDPRRVRILEILKRRPIVETPHGKGEAGRKVTQRNKQLINNLIRLTKTNRR